MNTCEKPGGGGHMEFGVLAAAFEDKATPPNAAPNLRPSHPRRRRVAQGGACPPQAGPRSPAAFSGRIHSISNPGLSNHEIKRRQSRQQHPALQQNRNPVQPPKLRQQRITLRGRLNRSHLHPQNRHPRTNRNLRSHRKPNHQHHTKHHRRNKSSDRPSTNQPRQQQQNPANHPQQMHPPQRKPHHSPSSIPATQNPKSPRRHHKAKKHIAPHPQPQTQKLNGPQHSRHGRKIAEWLKAQQVRSAQCLQGCYFLLNPDIIKNRCSE